ncbi:hypothetical protein F5Y16DRAFT_404400 [Xylariaceae sp. FL0255]|nr:hypothetical protein F5Y16DRAFT_404400 [Xylariaceae sp. FL0255]
MALNTTQVLLPGSSANQPAPDAQGNPAVIVAVIWTLLGLTVSLVALRIYCRCFQGRRELWTDDYFLLIALACLIANAITIQEWVQWKTIPKLEDIPASRLVLTGSLLGLFNAFALAFSKITVAIMFMRLTSDWWKCSLCLAAICMFVLFTVQAWTYWLQDCISGTEPYRTQYGYGDCITYNSVAAFRLAVQVLSCVFDLYLTVLPWKVVYGLDLKKFDKIGLAIALSFGCFSLTCGLIRMAMLVHAYMTIQPQYAPTGFVWNYCEPLFTIMAACVPILRKVVLDIVKWVSQIAPSKRLLNHFRAKHNSNSSTSPKKKNNGERCQCQCHEQPVAEKTETPHTSETAVSIKSHASEVVANSTEPTKP